MYERGSWKLDPVYEEAAKQNERWLAKQRTMRYEVWGDMGG
jgi:hypothetical protein